MLVLKDNEVIPLSIENDIRLIFDCGTQDFINMLIDVIEQYPTLELLCNKVINILIDSDFYLNSDLKAIQEFKAKYGAYGSDTQKRSVNAHLTLKINQLFSTFLEECERVIYVENSKIESDKVDDLDINMLKDMKVIDLRFLAKNIGVSNYARKNKFTLLEEIESIKNDDNNIIWNN